MVAKFATNARGAMLLLNLIQVMESISGSVVPLAMFFYGWLHIQSWIPYNVKLILTDNPVKVAEIKNQKTPILLF